MTCTPHRGAGSAPSLYSEVEEEVERHDVTKSVFNLSQSY